MAVGCGWGRRHILPVRTMAERLFDLCRIDGLVSDHEEARSMILLAKKSKTVDHCGVYDGTFIKK